MQDLLDFARGPLFRFSLAVMILGLLRIIVLDLVAAIRAYRRAGDTTIPWGYVVQRTLRWLFPVNRLLTRRPVYSLLSVLFHIGLLGVPIFLFAHVQLWRGALGFGWPALPKPLADWMTVSTVVLGLALVIGRITSRESRFLSHRPDYLWPVLLVIPFITGFICANLKIGPMGYQTAMLVHVLSGEALFLLLPFTKLAHCVLAPLSQLITGVAWRFPAETDEAVCKALNKEGAPV